MSEQTLNSKVALVTGAGRGIGRAVSIRLAELGATVILVGKTLSHLEEVYDTITTAGHPQPILYDVDFEHIQPQQLIDMGEAVSEQFGQLDILVHNAAFLGALAPIEHTTPKLWYQTFQINVHMPYLLTQALLPALQQADSAHILFTEDKHVKQGKAYWNAYAASKAAFSAFATTLKEELEETSINVDIISPEPTNTYLRKQAYPAQNPTDWAPVENIAELFIEKIT